MDTIPINQNSFSIEVQQRFVTPAYQPSTDVTIETVKKILFSAIFLIFWPIVTIVSLLGSPIYKRTGSRTQFAKAIMSILIMVSSYYNIFPLSMWIYFLVTYLVALIMEFRIFLRTSMISFRASVQEVDDIIQASIPSPQIFDLIYGLLLLSIIMIFIDGKNGTYGYVDSYTNTAIFTFIFLSLARALDAFRTYQQILVIFRRTSTTLPLLFQHHNEETLYNVSKTIIETRYEWEQLQRDLFFLDMSLQTISTCYALLIVVSQNYDIPWLSDYLAGGSSFIEQDQHFPQFCSALLSVNVLGFLLKLYPVYQATSEHENTERKINDITHRLSYIVQDPQSFIAIRRNNVKLRYQEVKKQAVNWNEVNIDEKAFEELFGSQENSIKPTFDRIRNENATGLTYGDLMSLVSEETEDLSGRFQLVRTEYERLYGCIEYQLFGFLKVNTGFAVKGIATLITAGLLLILYLYEVHLRNEYYNPYNNYNYN